MYKNELADDIIDEIRATNPSMLFYRSPKTVAQILDREYADSKIMLYGTGGHTKEVIDLLEKASVCGLISDDGQAAFETEIPVYKTSSLPNGGYDVIVMSNSMFSAKMARDIVEAGADKDRILDIYNSEKYLDDFFSNFTPPYEIEPRIDSKKNLLLIVPFENADHITRSSDLLKDDFTLYKLYYANSNMPESGGAFRRRAFIERSLIGLIYTITRYRENIDLVVLNLVPGFYHLVRIIKKACPDLPVVVSILDFLSFFGAKEKVMTELELGGIYDLEIESEDFMIKNADGILLSAAGDIVDKEIISRTRRAVQAYNYMPMSSCVCREPDEGPLSLCYAGGMLPSGSRKIISEDIKMIKVFRRAIDSGFRVRAYFSNVYQGADNSAVYGDYMELAQKSDFMFFPNQPVHKLINMISGYHFGIMFYDFAETDRHDVMQKHLKTVIPTKIFTYLAAGLPIIISDKLEAAAAFVAEHGIGIVINSDDINHLDRIITGELHKKLKANILRAQKELSAENNSGRLISLLKSVC